MVLKIFNVSNEKVEYDLNIKQNDISAKIIFLSKRSLVFYVYRMLSFLNNYFYNEKYYYLNVREIKLVNELINIQNIEAISEKLNALSKEIFDKYQLTEVIDEDKKNLAIYRILKTFINPAEYSFESNLLDKLEGHDQEKKRNSFIRSILNKYDFTFEISEIIKAVKNDLPNDILKILIERKISITSYDQRAKKDQNIFDELIRILIEKNNLELIQLLVKKNTSDRNNNQWIYIEWQNYVELLASSENLDLILCIIKNIYWRQQSNYYYNYGQTFFNEFIKYNHSLEKLKSLIKMIMSIQIPKELIGKENLFLKQKFIIIEPILDYYFKNNLVDESIEIFQFIHKMAKTEKYYGYDDFFALFQNNFAHSIFILREKEINNGEIIAKIFLLSNIKNSLYRLFFNQFYLINSQDKLSLRNFVKPTNIKIIPLIKYLIKSKLDIESLFLVVKNFYEDLLSEDLIFDEGVTLEDTKLIAQELIELFLKHLKTLNSTNIEEPLALFLQYAIEQNAQGIIQVLLENGVDFFAKNPSSNKSYLEEYIYKHVSNTEKLESVYCLIEKFQSYTSTSIDNFNGIYKILITTAFKLKHFDYVKLFVNKLFEKNSKDLNVLDLSLFFSYAWQCQSKEIIFLLIELSISNNALDIDKKVFPTENKFVVDPIFLETFIDELKILKINEALKCKIYEKLLLYSVQFGLKNVFIKLYEINNSLIYKLNEKKENIFHIALANNKSEMIALFFNIFEKTKILSFLSMKDNDGNIPLHIAARKGDVNSSTLLMMQSDDGIYAVNNHGRNALHLASCRKNNQFLITLLLKKGFDINAVDSIGRTALHYAVDTNCKKNIYVLLKAKPNINMHDNLKGQTALHLAVLNDENFEYFEDLIKLNPKIDALNDYNDTAIHLASKEGDLDILNLLISKKAKLNIKNLNGKTPLHLASEEGMEKCIERILECISIKEINEVDINGNTPLHLALKKKYIEEAKILIKKGASLSIKNNEGKTPLDLINSFSQQNMMEMRKFVWDNVLSIQP